MKEIKTFITKDANTINLRPAIPVDAKDIIATLNSSALERSYVLMEMFGKDEDTVKNYISELNQHGSLLLVALDEDVVVGCLGALVADNGDNPQSAHILNTGIHIKKTHRGVGIGSHMLNYAVSWARDNGFTKLVASIFTSNENSLHLFKSAGFEEEGIRRKQFRIGSEFIDEVIMAKLL